LATSLHGPMLICNLFDVVRINACTDHNDHFVYVHIPFRAEHGLSNRPPIPTLLPLLPEDHLRGTVRIQIAIWSNMSLF